MDRQAFLADLIGKPYRLGGSGPKHYDCYGLTRHIQKTLGGIDMPPVPYAEPTTRAAAEAMLRHPERQKWREVPLHELQDLDVVLMGNVSKRDFHLGTFIVPSVAGGVLHVDHGRGVVFDDIPTLRAIGFNHLTFYRRGA